MDLFDGLRDPQVIARYRDRPQAFTRERKLPFRVLVGLLLNQVKGAWQREVGDFFERCLQGAQSVSAAAVCLARKALDPGVFVDLNQRLVALVAAAHAGERWHGLRLMAVDGSTLNLHADPEIVDHFGGQQSSSGFLPMARFSGLLDIGSSLIWDASITPYSVGESATAVDHLPSLPNDALVLYDRGYSSFYLYALHRRLSRHVCMRVPRKFSPAVDAVFADPAAPTNITLYANRSARALCRENSVDANPLMLRAVRVLLNTGEVEVLLTDLLDSTEYPDADFAALYARRWTIEGDFRHLKSRLQLENPSGRSVRTCRQDIHARVLAKNLAAALVLVAQTHMDQQRAAQSPDQRTRQRRKINFTHATHLCKYALIAALLNPCAQAVERIVKAIALSTHAERPGRSYPRKRSQGKSKRYPMAYKQTG